MAHHVGYGSVSHLRFQKISYRVGPVQNREPDGAARLLQVLVGYFRERTWPRNAGEPRVAVLIPAAGIEDLRVQSRAPPAVGRARWRTVARHRTRITGFKRFCDGAHVGRSGALDRVADA